MEEYIFRSSMFSSIRVLDSCFALCAPPILYGPSMMFPPLSDEQAAIPGPQLENMLIHLPPTDDAMRAFNAIRPNKRKTASFARSSQLAPPPTYFSITALITSAAPAEIGTDIAHPIESKGMPTKQLH